MTTKHARRGEMGGHFSSPSMQARRVWGDNQACKERRKRWAISPHKAFKQNEFGVTTKHAMRGEMVGHFNSPRMQGRTVWGDNQACKEGLNGGPFCFSKHASKDSLG